MIHASDKGAQIPEHAFNLRGESKLEFLVDVHAVRDLPPLLNRSINPCSIRLQSGLRLHVLEEELRCILLVHGRFLQHTVCQDARSNLLRHEERKTPKVCLVHLDRSCKNGLKIRELKTEESKPVIHRFFAHMAELFHLEHRNSVDPTPEECPKGPERELRPGKPRTGEQCEGTTTSAAPIPFF